MRSGAAQRGQAIVLVALMMSVLLGFVALGIDSARAFDARRALQDATDSAALAAADYYSTSKSWQSAADFGAATFAENLRLSGGGTCPNVTVPSSGGTVTGINCSVAAPASMTLAVTDQGARGQTFSYFAHYSMSVVMMQVLGLSPSLTLNAKASGTTLDQALTPALGGLSTSCSSNAINVTGSTGVVIYGDVVANGKVTTDAGSSVKVAGDVISHCAAATGNWSYYCWQSSVPDPAVAPGTCAQPVTANRIGGLAADPALPAPSTTSLNPATWPSQSSGAFPAVVQPGIYAVDPNVGPLSGTSTNQYPCYFMAAGVYQFKAGFTIRNGLISNSLRPPEPDPKKSPQHPFWAQDISNGGAPQPKAHCAGDSLFTAVASSNAITPTGTWSFQVTSVRTDYYNGTAYTRESSSSNCRTVNIAAGQAIKVVISNVPGAQSYNVYAAPPSAGTCPSANSAFGFVGNFAINYLDSTYGCVSQPSLYSSYCQSNQNTSGCPSTATPQVNCSLGQWGFTIDSTKISNTWTVNNTAAAWTAGAAMPDDGLSPWLGAPKPSTTPSLGNPAAVPATGDLANVNFCASPTGPSSAPPYRRSSCPGTVNPGGVVLYIGDASSSSAACLSVQSNADYYGFSGPQYNWAAVYEPASNACSSNLLDPLYTSAIEGLYYAPAATLQISGLQAVTSPYTSGFVVGTLNINASSNTYLVFDPHYAPYSYGARLTG